MKINNKKLCVLFFAFLAVYFLLVFLFPEQRESGIGSVYYFGFSDTFLTIYNHEFRRSGPNFQFSLDALQLVINILKVWLVSFFAYILFAKIKNYFSQRGKL